MRAEERRRPLHTKPLDVPQYDDQNAYDALSKALDIFTVADAGIQIWQVPIGALAEAGFIVAASLAAVIAPAVAIGSGHNDALRKTSRDFFFTGFCSALVMRADGWKTSTVESFFPEKQYPPLNSVYPEKRETFRKLYNFGLKAGALQARRMSVEDKMNLFTFLRLRLTDAERMVQYPKGDVPSWSQQKQKDYYVRLASIMKDVILTNNLQVKVS